MHKSILPVIGFATLAIGLFFFFKSGEEFQVSYGAPEAVPEEVKTVIVPEPPKEVPNQKPLANPPEVIKAVYATSWSASSASKMAYLIDLIKKTELNAIVIDIKDYAGIVSYDIEVPEVKKYGAVEVRIPKINELIKKLHDENIYVIGRLTVFQDPKLAKARPNLAIKNSATGEIWKDNKGIAWIDASAMEAWDYNIAIAKNAVEHGFDEINFDYVRFPSDGKLSLMQYPFTDLKTTYKSTAIKTFFQYVRANTQGMKISADLFGLTTVNLDDLGIGQVIEYAYENFDFVAPMIYPSHYASGFMNLKNPAEHPYAVIERSMQKAYERLMILKAKNPTLHVAELRPWLQDFDLGATYDAEKVIAQIKATEESFCKAYAVVTPGTVVTNADGTTKTVPAACDKSKLNDFYNGWMLWDPRNNYTPGALKAE